MFQNTKAIFGNEIVYVVTGQNFIIHTSQNSSKIIPQCELQGMIPLTYVNYMWIIKWIKLILLEVSLKFSEHFCFI